MENQSLITFLEEQNLRFHENTAVKPYITIGIGGTVSLVILVNDESQLKELLIFLHQAQYKYVFLGGGSNVVFPDGHSPLIVVVNRTSGIFPEPENRVRVSSGVFIMDLMKWNIANRAGGMEFLAGIPGTMGGAAAVNAGAFGNSISTILEKAEIITPANEIKTVDNSYFEFTYRNSRFKYNDEVILNVTLRYTDAPADQIKEQVEANVAYRKKNHPGTGQRSAGCFFKNPEIEGKKLSAGRLIEQAGFKGQTYNHLEVSAAHANFIINSSDATFRDICDLESRIREGVSNTNHINLEREVIYISPDGKKY